MIVNCTGFVGSTVVRTEVLVLVLHSTCTQVSVFHAYPNVRIPHKLQRQHSTYAATSVFHTYPNVSIPHIPQRQHSTHTPASAHIPQRQHYTQTNLDVHVSAVDRDSLLTVHWLHPSSNSDLVHVVVFNAGGGWGWRGGGG